MNGQLTFDDCTPGWTEPEPRPQRRPAGTRYHVAPQSDLLGQRLHVRRTSRKTRRAQARAARRTK